MWSPRHRPLGRTALLAGLAVLLVTIGTAVYLVLGQDRLGPGGIDPGREGAGRLTTDVRRLAALLTILLVSALLALLFVIGTYVLLRVGRWVARSRLGGSPTPYVDAWSRYRLTEDQISAATAEDQADDQPEGPTGGPDQPRWPTDPPNPQSGS